jgi:hypothetical protein
LNPAELDTAVSTSGKSERNFGMTKMMDRSPWSNPKRRPPTQAVITHSDVSLEEKISRRAIEVRALHCRDL